MHHVRHELEEDGKLVQFLFRGDKVVAEKMEDNIIRLIRGYDLVASDAEAARTYYHYVSNELGSITHVADEREILNRYEYDVWGNLAVCEETVPNRFLFTGQQYDPLTQQYYLRARFYNPAITRFTQEDTYRGDGLNLYAYCRNNPVCYVDPSGHSCDKDSDGGQAQVPLLPAPPPILALPGPVADGDTKSDASGQKPSVPLLPGPEPVPRLPGPTADTPSSEHRGQGNNEGGSTTTNPYNLQPTHSQTLSNNKLNALMDDIKVNGIQEPIKYVEYNGQKYVVDGHHRLLAAKRLGLTEVPIERVELPYAGYSTIEDLLWFE